ncbi:MAG TPA: glycoside hydrolase family 11 protein [Polyangiaceae bacterium]
MRSLRPTLWSAAAITACVAATLTACAVTEDDPDASAGAGGSGGSTGGAGTGGKSAGGAGTGGVMAAGGTVSGGAGFGGKAAGGGTSGGSAGATSSGGTTSAGTANGGAGIGGGGSGTGGSPGGTGGGSSGTGGGSGGGSSGTGAAGGGGTTGGSAGAGGGGTGGSGMTCPPSMPMTGGNRYCSNTTGNVGNTGYSYELWAEGSGTGCMTVYGDDATFSANWTNVEDLLARVGLNFDRNRKHAQIGTLKATFAETKAGSDNLVYIGIYGWTVNPLKEYYILDDWGEIKPAGTASDGTPRDFVGEFTVDGETYDVWKKLRVDKPSILGDSDTFEQYFSIRRTARECGTISISEHFHNWEELGLELGNLTEAKILVEAQDSSGTIDFSEATVTVD